jgi:carbonic anhydrase/acetyltransferase-like protein (isoleucine patch superfamily)
VVGPETKVPARTLVRGVPARVARTLSAEEVRAQRARALEYVETSRHYARKSAS